MKNKNQLRAQFWIDKIASANRLQPQAWKDAFQTTQSLPVAIRQNGLLLVIAQLVNEEKEGKKIISQSLADWLLKQMNNLSTAPTSNPKDLFDALQAADNLTYMQATTEALASLEWAKALLKTKALATQTQEATPDV